MEELAELHRFNAWANRRLLAAVRQLEPERLHERREGMYNTIVGVLTHFSGVELGYLCLMRSEPFEPPPARLDNIAQALEQSGQGLVELAHTAEPEATFHVPWLDSELSVAQGLRHVLTHSMNHRADVNQWLPSFGVESVPADYLALVLSER
jgi:uncharacterized damage-inducible protein DinB